MSRLFRILFYIAIRALACWTETPPLNLLLSQHCTVCGSQTPVSSRKSRSPVKSKDEQWKFRIQTAAIAIFKVLKAIYKPLRQVETTLSPFFRMRHEEVQWTHFSTDWPCLGSQKLTWITLGWDPPTLRKAKGWQGLFSLVKLKFFGSSRIWSQVSSVSEHFFYFCFSFCTQPPRFIKLLINCYRLELQLWLKCF